MEKDKWVLFSESPSGEAIWIKAESIISLRASGDNVIICTCDGSQYVVSEDMRGVFDILERRGQDMYERRKSTVIWF